MEDVHVGWLFSKNSFIEFIEQTKEWIESLLVGAEFAKTLGYQIRSQVIKCAKIGIKVKTYGYGICASKYNAKKTCNAIVGICYVSVALTQ